MEFAHKYYHLFSEYVASHPFRKEPIGLYEPADYILSLGGKRIRPIFVLTAHGLYRDDVDKSLLASMAVEVFHNFTLLHDDIMDNSDIRRGQPTVHKKYNVNTGILSGDLMMIQAYQYILDYKDPVLVKKLLDIFNKMAIEVCEGQQLDVDFETRNNVTIPEYLHMITLKTSVLLGAAMQLGSCVSGATESDQKHMYEFAKNFGIAFQLQDDILDTFGDTNEIGKKIGGDILRNKKTYLFLKALELGDNNQKDILSQLYSDNPASIGDEKIEIVTKIFKDLYVTEYSKQLIEAYRDLAFSHLASCSIQENKKHEITQYIDSLIFRTS